MRTEEKTEGRIRPIYAVYINNEIIIIFKIIHLINAWLGLYIGLDKKLNKKLLN